VRVYGYADLERSGNDLRLTKRGPTLATIEPDAEWAGLWRVRLPNGHLSSPNTRHREDQTDEHAFMFLV
jgi:hypothetical protein